MGLAAFLVSLWSIGRHLEATERMKLATKLEKERELFSEALRSATPIERLESFIKE